MEKRAFIIGGTGFLGSGIAEELHRAGWRVTVMGRGRVNNPAPAFAEFVQGDRSQPGEWLQAVRSRPFELVVDCAGYRLPDAEGAVQGLTGYTSHYVFISTDYVYAAHPQATYPIAEDSQTQRDTSYASGKLECEEIVTKAWRELGFPATVLRPPHILGAGKALGSDPVWGRDARLTDKLREGQTVPLAAEGTLLIQPVWNREIGRCIDAIFGHSGSMGQIFNLAGADCVTTLDYYRIVAELLGVPLRHDSVAIAELVRQKPETRHYIRHRIYDMGKLAAATGYVPRLKLNDALAETVHWMDRAGREEAL